MGVITLTCANCGGKLEADDGTREPEFCTYCGTRKDVFAHGAFNTAVAAHAHNAAVGAVEKEVERLLADGKTFMTLHEFGKASKAFERAAELAPGNWRAWFGYAKTTKGDAKKYVNAAKLADAAGKKEIFDYICEKEKFLTDENFANGNGVTVGQALTVIEPSDWRGYYIAAQEHLYLAENTGGNDTGFRDNMVKGYTSLKNAYCLAEQANNKDAQTQVYGYLGGKNRMLFSSYCKAHRHEHKFCKGVLSLIKKKRKLAVKLEKQNQRIEKQNKQLEKQKTK